MENLLRKDPKLAEEAKPLKKSRSICLISSLDFKKFPMLFTFLCPFPRL